MKKKEIAIRIFGVILGSFLCAIAINAFVIPHKLLSGGVSGIALIIQYITNFSSGYAIFLLNIPIFIVGLKKMDKDFIIYSLLGMIFFSAFLILTRGISEKLIVDDILLSTIYAGVINGIGGGIVFRNRASLGGTDIIAVVLKRAYGISIPTVSMIISAFVVIIGLTINSIEAVMYTLIFIYITSVVINRVIEGFDRNKLLFIVTEKEKEVSEAIMKELGRGATYFYGEGAYTGENKKVIYCIVTLSQLTRTKKIISDIDSAAFMSIIDASEVRGSDFKEPAL